MYPVRWMTGRFGLIKDGMLTVEEFVKSAPHDPRTETVAKVYTEYQRRLKEAGAFDFDDLIYFTVRLLQENPEVRELYMGLSGGALE